MVESAYKAGYQLEDALKHPFLKDNPKRPQNLVDALQKTQQTLETFRDNPNSENFAAAKTELDNTLKTAESIKESAMKQIMPMLKKIELVEPAKSEPKEPKQEKQKGMLSAMEAVDAIRHKIASSISQAYDITPPEGKTLANRGVEKNSNTRIV